jgi:hypothetical protein
MGTIACAAAITNGEVLLMHGRLDLLGAAAPALIEAGVDLRQTPEGVIARRSSAVLVGIDFQTRPYPGFATDLQAPVMALLSTAVGASMVTETVFEHRFRHVDELRKMGANIKVFGRAALLRGVPKLQGALVMGMDVRGAGALVIAGLGLRGRPSSVASNISTGDMIEWLKSWSYAVPTSFGLILSDNAICRRALLAGLATLAVRLPAGAGSPEEERPHPSRSGQVLVDLVRKLKPRPVSAVSS